MFNRPSSLHLCCYAILVIACAPGPLEAGAPSDSDQAYRTATGLLNRGLEDLAAAEYRAFLRQQPDHPLAPSARYGLAVCLVRLGNHAEAIADLDRLAQNPGFEFAADVKVLQGECRMALGRFDEAGDWFDRAIHNHPDQARADFVTSRLGESRYRAGQLHQARAALQTVIDRWPGSEARERCEYILALCEVADSQDQSAANDLAVMRTRFPNGACIAHATLLEAQCRHRLGESDRALELYRSASQLEDPSIKPSAMLGLAQLARAAGRPADAQLILDDLGRRFPTSAVLGAAALERARACFDEGRFEEARSQFVRLVDSGSEEAPTACLWAARCTLRLNQAEAAAELLASGVKRWAKSELAPELIFELAMALSAAHHDLEAAAAYERIVKEFRTSPRAADAMVARAGVLHKLEQFEESLSECRQFLARHADHPRQADARLLLAENEYFLARYLQAERSYANALPQLTDGAQSWRATVRRGLCLIRLDREEEGQALLTVATASPPPEETALARTVFVALGDLAFDNADWPVAEKWLTRVIESRGTSADEGAMLRLGLSVHRQGRLEDAIAVYDRLIQSSDTSDVVLHATFERGQALIELNRPEEASAALQNVVAQATAQSQFQFRSAALRHLASLAARQGKPAEAASLLGQLAAMPGQRDGAADALLDRGLMLVAAEEFEQAREALARFVERTPDHARAGEARAYLAISMSRLGHSEDAITEIARLEPDLAALDESTRQTLLYEKAWTLRRIGRESESRTAYEQVLASGPAPGIEACAAVDLAQLFLNDGSPEQALSLLHRAETAAARAAEPARSTIPIDSMYLRGACFVRLERFAEAAKSLEGYLDQQPAGESAASAGLLLADALMRIGRSEQAVRRIRAVIDRESEEATIAVALLRLGDACAASQDWNASEEAFAEFLRRFASSDLWFQARFGIGWARENAGHPEAALEAYAEVVARHQGPTAARAQFEIGECLFALKRHEEAVRELLKVDILFTAPQWSAAALYEAGRCLREMNREAEARRQFQQVIYRFPDTEWARLAIELLAATQPAPLPGANRRTDASSDSAQPR